LRHWTANHDRFSTDFHRGLGLLGSQLSRALHSIRRAYDPALRGILAGAITLGLWTTVLVLATPATGHAESSSIELAAVLDGPIEAVIEA
jgi:hypothetical protein